MKFREIRWNAEKDELLRSEPGRGGIGLSECAVAIEEGRILDDIQSPSRPNQRMFILDIEGYAFVVPYVFDESGVFLKTMFPSRDYTAKYLRIRQ
jgi:hypothetical protein